MSRLCPETGKICYTKDEAKRAALALKRNTVTNRGVDAFRCPEWKRHECSRHYHIGHARKRY